MYFQLPLMTFTSWKRRGEARAMQTLGSVRTTSVPAADHRRARGPEPKAKEPQGSQGAGCEGWEGDGGERKVPAEEMFLSEGGHHPLRDLALQGKLKIKIPALGFFFEGL